MKALDDLGTFSTDTFQHFVNTSFQLCANATQTTSNPSEELNILKANCFDGIDKALLKKTLAECCQVAAEILRACYDEGLLSHVLSEETNLSQERIGIVLRAYEREKDVYAQGVLRKEVIGKKRIVDLDWRLDYDILNSVRGKVTKPMYLITIKSVSQEDDADNVQSETFRCTLPQLQDIVFRLRDAKNQVDKLTNS